MKDSELQNNPYYIAALEGYIPPVYDRPRRKLIPRGKALFIIGFITIGTFLKGDVVGDVAGAAFDATTSTWGEYWSNH